MRRRTQHLSDTGAVAATTGPVTGSDFNASLRKWMVREQIEGRGIRHSEILRVLRVTPRHVFIPEVLRAMAYDDCALPIGFGATISQPYVVALMTELLLPQKDHRVLEIGTGSGYQAAVLAQLTRQVYSIEITSELAKAGQQMLASAGYSNVAVRRGDGCQGWPEEAPFDRVIVTAAPQEIPQVLIDQLSPGGRLVAPVGPYGSQELILLRKQADGTVRSSPVTPVLFIPMKTQVG